MFNQLFNTLTQHQKGMLWMITGIILLLHTLGIIERGLNYIIIIGSLGMIAYGFYMLGGHRKLLGLLHSKR